MSFDSDLVALFETIAPQIGATLTVEPTYRRAGRLRFANGAVLFFRKNHLNINPASNARMTADKAYLSSFLHQMGFGVLAETTFAARDLRRSGTAAARMAETLAFAETVGWPVIVKPNSKSQGRSVQLVGDPTSLRQAVLGILQTDTVCIVQQYCAMPEYRLVVLNGSLIQAYRRTPLSVTGDGSTAVGALVSRRVAAIAGRRQEAGDAILDNARRVMAAKGIAEHQIIPAGVHVVVSDTANLSAGGEAVDVSGLLHPDWARLAVKLARQCGLLLCGVDMFIDDIGAPAGAYRVIELNSSPGLDDYLLEHDAQRKRVEDLYRSVLQVAAAAGSAVVTRPGVD